MAALFVPSSIVHNTADRFIPFPSEERFLKLFSNVEFLIVCVGLVFAFRNTKQIGSAVCIHPPLNRWEPDSVIELPKKLLILEIEIICQLAGFHLPIATCFWRFVVFGAKIRLKRKDNVVFALRSLFGIIELQVGPVDLNKFF